MTGGPGARRGRRPRLWPALPRPAWVVLGGDLISAAGSGLTLPCLFIYAHRVRDLSYGTAGLVVATIALASLAGNPAGGAAADRWTPRRALMAGLVLAAAGLSAVFAVRHACLNAGLGLGALGAAAVVSLTHPGTFTVVYLADAATFLAFLPVLARLRPPAPPASATPPASEMPPASDTPPAGRPRTGVRQVLADKAFVRVWALTALLVTVSFGQFGSSLAGYATRPGGIDPRGLALAFAANTVTVAGAQLFVLRALAGRRRTTAAALAATAWAASWAVVIAGGHPGGGAAAQIAFAAAAVIFALGECLLAPTLPAIINDLAPPGAAGRYNGLGVLAFTTGFLLGPAAGGAALGAGRGTGLFAALVLACAAAAVAALRLGRHLPPAANHIPAPGPSGPAPAGSSDHAAAGSGPDVLAGRPEMITT